MDTLRSRRPAACRPACSRWTCWPTIWPTRKPAATRPTASSITFMYPPSRGPQDGSAATLAGRSSVPGPISRKARCALPAAPRIWRFPAKGFFAVDGPSGSLFTRNGSFRVSPRRIAGHRGGIRGADGIRRGLAIQPSGDLQVSPDGTVSQNGQVLGRLEIADFSDTGALVKQGASYFRSAAASQPASGA
jgi:hypothetical protein